MQKNFVLNIVLLLSISLYACIPGHAQTDKVKQGSKYDTIIRKHVTKPIKKPEPPPLVLPTPEFINQPYYYDKNGNRLIKLENTSAQMVTKKKTLGLKGAKQFLSMVGVSSKIRFTSKKDIVFFIKTSGDVIDLTSYIKLYFFLPIEQRRDVTITSKEGLLADKDEARGKLINIAVKMISKDNYQVQLPDQLQAGEYGFVWVKNMELKEFAVFAFGIDWEKSN